MKLLLDTHPLVWWLNDDVRLSVTARDAIADPENEVHVSAAGAWELATKARRGRWTEAEELVANFDAVQMQNGFRPLPITTAHALRAGGLEGEHQDPFDRMLAAQALTEGAVLITIDHRIRSFGAETLR